MGNPYEAPRTDQPQPVGSGGARKKRLWAWFGIGFLCVFIVMAICVRMYTVSPAGNAAVRCPLWRYYLVEFHRQVSSTTLGPASAGGTGLTATVFVHALISTLGGGVLLAARLLVRPTRNGEKANTA
jgi:hypothetical protein